MSDTPKNDPPETAPAPAVEALGAMSVIAVLASDGKAAPSVSLSELDEESVFAHITASSEKYRVLKTIGEGGMGRVLLVLDRDMNRKVALKMIKVQGRELERRFLEEAQIMGQLEHPNIVPLHDLGLTPKKRPYYTMSYVHGLTLQQVIAALAREEPAFVHTYTLVRLLQIFSQVVQAVSYAHAKGVIHRDLKPSNVVLGQHGEVQVLDWGLAKVMQGGQVKTDLAQSLTSTGAMLGTLSHMAPEQAAGKEVDARADVYSLGVMLYEILTLSVPFEGSQIEVLAALARDEPLQPRRRAPRRQIPEDLETACLRALRKDPAERLATAAQLGEAVQSWLESELDRGRKHDLAETQAVKGLLVVAEYRRLRARLVEVRATLERLNRELRPWQPLSDKRALIESLAEIEDLKNAIDRAFGDAAATFTTAVRLEPENITARRPLADLLWDRFRDSEELGDLRGMTYFRRILEMYHDGRYAAELQGDGRLDLTTEPPGATVTIHEIHERDLQLAPGEGRPLGLTPIDFAPLPMGSYVVQLSQEGFRPACYPVLITRNKAWTGRVRLYREDEIGADFIHVSGGPFLQGGDTTIQEGSLPRAAPDIPDFFIARFAVTVGEYIEFLDDLARRDRDEALRRAPRRASDGGSYLELSGDGHFVLPADRPGEIRWQPRLPIFGVSWEDAVAYTAWRSARDGRAVRLATEVEWEKAARGVDGRAYPWGNRFDASLCNTRESQRERPTPAPVDEFPSDVSVYGVRGMAGNVMEWTSTSLTEGEGEGARLCRVVRGGGWDLYSTLSRCAFRYRYLPSWVGPSLGFRLAATPAT